MTQVEHLRRQNPENYQKKNPPDNWNDLFKEAKSASNRLRKAAKTEI